MQLEMLSVPPCNLTVSKFDKINLLVALIALAVALASLAYSFWMNRRKIDITDCFRFRQVGVYMDDLTDEETM